MNLYLTRKARRREEQSCSRQEELQRNRTSDGWIQGGGAGGSGHSGRRENISKVNKSLTEREYEKRVKEKERERAEKLAKNKQKISKGRREERKEDKNSGSIRQCSILTNRRWVLSSKHTNLTYFMCPKVF